MKEQLLTVSVSLYIDSCANCILKPKLFYCVQAKRGALFGNPILFGNPLPYLNYTTQDSVRIEDVFHFTVYIKMVS